MNHKIFALSFCVLANVFLACNKDEINEKLLKEDQKLAEYMAEIPDAVQLSDGLYIDAPGNPENGLQPEAGDYVLVDYICKSLYSGTTEAVSYKEYVEDGVWIPCAYKSGGPELWELGKPLFGRHAGIGQMVEGQTANIYFSSRYYNQDFITRVYYITLKKVIKVKDVSLKAYQETLMSNYLKRYGDDVDSVKISDNNGNDYYLMYHVNNIGTGAKVTGNFVKTKTKESYLLMANDVRLCVDKEDRIWNADMGENMLKVLRQLNLGGKVIVMAPYKLIYGDNFYTINTNGYAQYLAPQGSVLIYDIDLQ